MGSNPYHLKTCTGTCMPPPVAHAWIWLYSLSLLIIDFEEYLEHVHNPVGLNDAEALWHSVPAGGMSYQVRALLYNHIFHL